MAAILVPISPYARKDQNRYDLILSNSFEFAGSTSPVPPHTSQRRCPVPLHSLQLPSVIPTIDFLPVPRHETQDVVLCPWHLGHKILFGMAALPLLNTI